MKRGIWVFVCMLSMSLGVFAVDCKVEDLQGDWGATAITVPDQCTSLSHVDQKDERFMKLNEGRAHILANALMDKPNISFIRLDVSELGDDGAIAIAKAVQKNNLAEFKVWGNNITDRGADEITAILQHVKDLDLGANRIGDAGAVAIANNLSSNKSIWRLNLGGNQIGPIGREALNDLEKKIDIEWFMQNETCELIGDWETGVTIPSICSALRYESLDDAKVKRLAHAIESLGDKSLLQRISLTQGNIGLEGAVALSHALSTNSTITTVNLHGNSLGDEAVRVVLTGLMDSKTLYELDLSDNNIGAEGAEVLAQLLKKSTSLKELTLYSESVGVKKRNHLKGKGIEDLADALKDNDTLEDLSLGGTGVGDEGAKKIADALMDNNGLRKLYLSENNIGDDGAKALARALSSNEALRELDLVFNNISDEGAKAFAKTLEDKEEDIAINLNFNRIGVDGATALESSGVDLELNTQIEPPKKGTIQTIIAVLVVMLILCLLIKSKRFRKKFLANIF